MHDNSEQLSHKPMRKSHETNGHNTSVSRYVPRTASHVAASKLATPAESTGKIPAFCAAALRTENHRGSPKRSRNHREKCSFQIPVNY
jgi:hypothetical protein